MKDNQVRMIVEAAVVITAVAAIAAIWIVTTIMLIGD